MRAFALTLGQMMAGWMLIEHFFTCNIRDRLRNVLSARTKIDNAPCLAKCGVSTKDSERRYAGKEHLPQYTEVAMYRLTLTDKDYSARLLPGPQRTASTLASPVTTKKAHRGPSR